MPSVPSCPSSRRGGLALRSGLLVQPLRDFLGVALVVQLEKTVEDLLTGSRTDREAEPCFSLVEAVPSSTSPTVKCRHTA